MGCTRSTRLPGRRPAREVSFSLFCATAYQGHETVALDFVPTRLLILLLLEVKFESHNNEVGPSDHCYNLFLSCLSAASNNEFTLQTGAAAASHGSVGRTFSRPYELKPESKASGLSRHDETRRSDPKKEHLPRSQDYGSRRRRCGHVDGQRRKGQQSQG